jgi:hypothetical protein
MLRRTCFLASALFGVVLFGASSPARAGSTIVSVSGRSGPWEFVKGGLNTNDRYGDGDQGAPTIVTAADGIAFAPGDSIQVRYLSGLATPAVNDLGIYPYVDADGETGVAAPNNSSYGGFGVAPSYFMPSSTYPIYWEELVGTFANSSGVIVGTPFAIGDSATLIVPAGATQLQLGVNDAGYDNDGGAFSIEVSGASVPEPSPLILLGIGVLGLLIRGLYRRNPGEPKTSAIDAQASIIFQTDAPLATS